MVLVSPMHLRLHFHFHAVGTGDLLTWPPTVSRTLSCLSDFLEPWHMTPFQSWIFIPIHQCHMDSTTNFYCSQGCIWPHRTTAASCSVSEPGEILTQAVLLLISFFKWINLILFLILWTTAAAASAMKLVKNLLWQWVSGSKQLLRLSFTRWVKWGPTKV